MLRAMDMRCYKNIRVGPAAAYYMLPVKGIRRFTFLFQVYYGSKAGYTVLGTANMNVETNITWIYYALSIPSSIRTF